MSNTFTWKTKFKSIIIVDGELTDAQAAALYNNGVPGDVSSQVSNTLVGWWRFEGNLNDSSTNGNNGVASNGATFSTDVPS